MIPCGAPPSRPQLNLITSRRPHLQTPTCWGLRYQHMMRGGRGRDHKHSINDVTRATESRVCQKFPVSARPGIGKDHWPVLTREGGGGERRGGDAGSPSYLGLSPAELQNAEGLSWILPPLSWKPPRLGAQGEKTNCRNYHARLAPARSVGCGVHARGAVTKAPSHVFSQFNRLC